MNSCINMSQGMFAFLASIVLSSSVWNACAENKVLTFIYGYIWKMTSDK